MQNRLDEAMETLSRIVVSHISSNCEYLPKVYDDLIAECCGVLSTWRKIKKEQNATA